MPIQLLITLEPVKGEKAEDHVPVLRTRVADLLPPALAVNAPVAAYRVVEVEAREEGA